MAITKPRVEILSGLPAGRRERPSASGSYRLRGNLHESAALT